MQLADFTLCECYDAHVGKAQALIDTCNVFLIVADAVQCLGIDNVKLSAGGLAQQSLDTGSGEGCSGDRVVRVDLGQLVSVLHNALAANPYLIVNRGRVLEVCAEPSINRSPHVSPPEWLGRNAGNQGINCTLIAPRKERQISLDHLSELSGIAKASLSKVENGKMSLTFAKLQQLSNGLGVEVAELFHEPATRNDSQTPPSARRSVDRAAAPVTLSTHHYSYTYLHTDLLHRVMTPFRMVLRARSMQDFGDLIRHAGEEFIVVLEGEVQVHTDHYAPVRLGPGDSLYIDSTMRHAYLSVGSHDATIICVCAGGPAASHVPQGLGE
jgi:transcriptional regulator with XRE-family HTH domain